MKLFVCALPLLMSIDSTAQQVPLQQPITSLLSRCSIPFPESIEAVRGGITLKRDTSGYIYQSLESAESSLTILKLKLAPPVIPTPPPAPSASTEAKETSAPAAEKKKGPRLEEVLRDPEHRKKMSELKAEEKSEYLRSLNINTDAEPREAPKSPAPGQKLTKEEEAAVGRIKTLRTCASEHASCDVAKALESNCSRIDTARVAIDKTHEKINTEMIAALRKAHQESASNKSTYEKKAREIIRDFTTRHEKAYAEELSGFSKKTSATLEKLQTSIIGVQADIDLLKYGASSLEASVEIASIQGVTLLWCEKILTAEAAVLRKSIDNLTLLSRAQFHPDILYRLLE